MVSTDLLEILCRLFQCAHNHIEILPSPPPKSLPCPVYQVRIHSYKVTFGGSGEDCAAVVGNPYGVGQATGTSYEKAICAAIADLSSVLMQRSLDLQNTAINLQNLAKASDATTTDLRST